MIKRTSIRRIARSRAPRVARQPPTETKNLVAALAPNVNTGGNLLLCNAIAKGTTDTTRVGNEVIVKSIRVRGFASVTPGTGVDQLHRYLVVWDVAPSGASPAILDILNAVNVYSFINEDNAWRFRILFDETVALNSTAESGSIHELDRTLKVNRKIHFNDNSLGDIRDIQSGALFFIAIGTSAAGATAGTFTGNSLVEYIDP